MADKKQKHPLNVPGIFFVDDSCVDCDICRDAAPQFFKRDDEQTGTTYVWRQPSTDVEHAAAQEALGGCPTDSIGTDPQ